MKLGQNTSLENQPVSTPSMGATTAADTSTSSVADSSTDDNASTQWEITTYFSTLGLGVIHIEYNKYIEDLICAPFFSLIIITLIDIGLEL